MAISLYDVSVTSYLQTLAAVSGYLDKGLGFCREQQLDPQQIVDTRIAPDMHPFHFQILSVTFHSRGALEGVLSGTFQPPGERPTLDYAGLQQLVLDTRAWLEGLSREQVDAREGQDLVFKTANSSRTFTAEGFLLSFALPNFYFHATTAYDILRGKGVPVGKRDYIGALRLKT
ncbi:MAG: hypothetical protein JWN48_809 [Myxococcaceae bacterium]|nr:hypothetical protein [Myxococcaceae bacterium]